MLALPNTTTADSYPTSGGASLGGQSGGPFVSGFLVVANAAVGVRYFYGLQGQAKPGDELFLSPGSYPLVSPPSNPLSGFECRSAVAGTPAQVWGALFAPNDPQISPGAEFTSRVTSGGVVTPVAQTAGRSTIHFAASQTSNEATIAHGLGTVPTSVVAIAEYASGVLTPTVIMGVGVTDAVTFKVEGFNVAGAVTTDVVFDWQATT